MSTDLYWNWNPFIVFPNEYDAVNWFSVIAALIVIFSLTSLIAYQSIKKTRDEDDAWYNLWWVWGLIMLGACLIVALIIFVPGMMRGINEARFDRMYGRRR